MYRVMIVDDEKAIRNLLKISVDWKSFNMEPVGEASSGAEAINIIDEIRPDVVFADIKMPFMDGIELSRILTDRYPGIKIIILTAFNDFEYARQCVGLGVCEYIMKPINPGKIREALKKIKVSLDERVVDLSPLEIPEDAMILNMDKIQKYIYNHYNDSDINLTSIAQHFGFNSSYLSRRFKNETGTGIIDYLTKCRMEKAVEYAKSRTLMYIAAQKVGINDPNYFSKCFRKYTGQTYSDYSAFFEPPKNLQ